MKNVGFIAQIQRSIEAYEIICKPVCDELQMPLPALDILMTLADNPCLMTAQEISRYKGIKPNLISFHVEKLVKAGFLERQPIEGNRRSIKLACTQKALPIIEHGRRMQALYVSLVSKGLSEEDILHFQRVVAKMDENMEAIKKKAGDGTLKLD